jgi:hypothetical protein
MTIKVSLDLPRKASGGDWQEIIREQLTEVIPEMVYWTDEDGNEYEVPVEVVE